MIWSAQWLTSDETNRFQHFPNLNNGECVCLRKPVAIGGPDYLGPRAELKDLPHGNRLTILADEWEDLTNVLPGVYC